MRRREGKMPQSFDDCEAIYRTHVRDSKSPGGTKIANNTQLIWDEGDPTRFGIRLYNTEIVTFYDDGRIGLDTGTWDTVLTKQRMNACLDTYNVFTYKRVWYVTTNKQLIDDRPLPVPTQCLGLKKAYGRRKFEDKMILHPEGLWYDEEMKYSE